ncbi:MAG: pimeloyl-ACP methyl ester carboxylesterase [Candidatus Azotimanducaceae bacterium]|jgi:pimeloyl-ACP methyl ester carboxylesterase
MCPLRIKITALLLSSLLLLAAVVQASPVQIVHQGLRLNGELLEANADSDTVFLLVHGTWAHGEMELISGMQSRLEELGENSLALTLSFGLDNRRGFMQCSDLIVAEHGAAIKEIRKWVEYLSNRFSKIIIVGHSRGANQVALYNQTLADPAVIKLVLIAPMTWVQNEAEFEYKARFDRDLSSLLANAKRHPDSTLEAGIINCDNSKVSSQSLLSYYSQIPNKNTPELLMTSTHPVLVFLGSEDELSKKYRDQNRRFPTSDLVTEIWIEGAGHFFLDLYLDELVETMDEWVRD